MRGAVAGFENGDCELQLSGAQMPHAKVAKAQRRQHSTLVFPVELRVQPRGMVSLRLASAQFVTIRDNSCLQFLVVDSRSVSLRP